MKQKILSILAENSRIPKKSLAMMIGASEEEVAAAMAELEDEKIILKYTTIVNWEKFNSENSVHARIDVRAQPQREVGYDEIARRICGYPEVKELVLMSGKYDFAVIVEAKTMMDVSKFVSSKLATIDGVQSTLTNFVLKYYKANEVTFDDTTVDRRQVVMP